MQTEWRGHSLCDRIGYILDNESPRGYASSFLPLCDEHGYSYEWINGQKPHLKKRYSSLSTSTPMTSSTEIDHSNHRPAIVWSESVDRQVRRDPYETDHHPAIVSSESVDKKIRWDPYSSETSEGLLHEPTRIPKPNQNKNHIREWLQEFRENLVDDRVPERRHSHASSSHELSLEPARTVDLVNSVYTHFPKDRNCEICQRTKITRAPRRRRIDSVVLRAENFGDLVTADHKVLTEGCESRNNHRHAIVVQDLAPMDPVVSVQD